MSDEGSEQSLEQRLLDESEPEDFGGKTSDEDEDFMTEMDEENTDSEDEDDDLGAETSCQQQRALNVRCSRGRPISRMAGKDGYTWSRKAARTSDRFSTTHVNIPGPKNDAKNCKSIEEFFKILFSQQMRDRIVHYTNIKIQKVLDAVVVSQNILQTYHMLTYSVEINAFIGLLLYMGIWKANRVSVKDLWSQEEGYGI
ncbi:uncharacterized protein [Venturia canescens]|uniref:uncharacterized protein n=1 Tax=Venturia canescens TaxID=32260 RepID=UPI001C9D2D57|nr:uncharacterized protein LOC122416883 [Venturia canescens]